MPRFAIAGLQPKSGGIVQIVSRGRFSNIGY
jgi:hypothetical protein